MPSKKTIVAIMVAMLALFLSAGALSALGRSPVGAMVARATTCVAASPAVRKIDIVGDSLTTVYGASDAEHSWPVMLQAHGASRGWVVNLHGIGSTMASQYLPGGPHFDVTERVRDSRPDLVLMDWRANEQLQGKTPDELKTNLLALAGQIRASSLNTKFMIVNPPLMWYHEFVSPEKQHTYAVKLREVAVELDGVFVDLEPYFPATGPSQYSRSLLFDDIHPNNLGHLKWFTVIYAAMRAATF